jgi:Phage-related tail fibre protein
MTIYTKPNYNNGVWANNGNIIQPTSEKIEQGHVVEKPKYELVNFIENRQDVAIAYLMQNGVPEWDNSTEYPVNAHIAYSGNVYKALTQNINEQPDLPESSSFWVIAWASNASVIDLTEEINKIKTEDGYLDLYVSKATPEVDGKVSGNGYLAAVGLTDTGDDNFGFSFKAHQNDGLFHDGDKSVILNDGQIVATFGSANPPLTENSSATATTQWVQSLISQVMDEILPIGAMISYSDQVVPSDRLMYAHGQAVSRTLYPILFQRIGTRFGAGDGSTTFNLPDKRGLFEREWDNGKGIDSGRELGTIQEDTVEKHKHIQQLGETYETAGLFGKSSNKGFQGSSGGLDNDNYLWYTNDGEVYQGADPNEENPNVMGDETRPKNIAFVTLIRVK